ncbi:hypothetical protein D3C86_1762360 [compost metagenome]
MLRVPEVNIAASKWVEAYRPKFFANQGFKATTAGSCLSCETPRPRVGAVTALSCCSSVLTNVSSNPFSFSSLLSMERMPRAIPANSESQA